MNIKRKIFWFHFLLLAVILNFSCKNSGYKTDNSGSVKEKTIAKIDSTQWLKKTRGIRDILEDENGNLWFSCPDYIAKFDGKAMYYFSENDGLSITGNIQEDISGTIWIENGFRVFKYDGKGFSEEKLDSITASEALTVIVRAKRDCGRSIKLSMGFGIWRALGNHALEEISKG